MVDILKNDEDGLEIYEVKSSTSVNSIYYDDASFQYYVLSGLGLNVKKVGIVYINNQYVRQKELDLDELFNIEDITSTVIEKQDEIRKNVEKINNFMREHDENNEPVIDIGNHCSKPYECDFWEYCTKDLKTGSTPEQEDIIDKESIKKLVSSLNYPLYFIDYETYMTPIPEIEGTRPYQQLPFQYSLHIIKEEGAPLEHKEFLAQADDDNFIRHFAESMTDVLSEEGSVIVYNKSFESSNVNKKLALMFPDLKDKIERINNNMVDFMIPFQQKKYYTKEMKGSHSIKKVLPALYPDLTYDNLSGVKEGMEASEAFLNLKNKPTEEMEESRKELLEYCKLDTYALVKIYEKFKEVLEE